MNHLVYQFLEQRISRRGFVRALGALGLSAAGVEAICRSAEAPARGAAPVARRVEGTGGKILVEQLKAAGVRFLFTNPGSFEVGFFDALLDEPVQLIMGLHEGIVIAMADGYHKVSRQPAFINVHVIAGTAQAAGQLYNASRDGSALVVTAGLLDNEILSDNLLLGARPSYNQKDINRQFTKMSWESHDSAGVAVMLRRAFKVATTPPGGPVYLAYSSVVLEGKASADVYDAQHFLIPSEVPPHPDRVAEVARMLLEAKRPLLIFSDEVAKTGAQAEGFELAELLGIPVHESPLPAFHSFPRHHALFTPEAATAGRDLVVSVGDYDLGDHDIRGRLKPERGPYDPGTKVVRIGMDTQSLGRNHPFSVVIVADARLALRALIDAVKGLATRERLDKLRSQRWPAEARGARKPVVPRAHQGLSPMHPDELGAALQQELDADAIVVSENLGGSNHFLSTGFRQGEKTWISNTGAGLGWGVGAATGAKLAAPDRQVVCNIGDGSVMYSAAGFWSQVRYGVPVLTVVCNNRNYQTVRFAYCRYEGRMKKANRFPGMHLGDPDIDFVKLAESQGVKGMRVERAADLPKALQKGRDATQAGEPFLIDVVVRTIGDGAGSTWHQEFNLARTRKRKV
jgi:benzoylformate decarboxylase